MRVKPISQRKQCANVTISQVLCEFQRKKEINCSVFSFMLCTSGKQTVAKDACNASRKWSPRNTNSEAFHKHEHICHRDRNCAEACQFFRALRKHSYRIKLYYTLFFLLLIDFNNISCNNSTYGTALLTRLTECAKE